MYNFIVWIKIIKIQWLNICIIRPEFNNLKSYNWNKIFSTSTRDFTTQQLDITRNKLSVKTK